MMEEEKEQQLTLNLASADVSSSTPSPVDSALSTFLSSSLLLAKSQRPTRRVLIRREAADKAASPILSSFPTEEVSALPPPPSRHRILVARPSPSTSTASSGILPPLPSAQHRQSSSQKHSTTSRKPSTSVSEAISPFTSARPPPPRPPSPSPPPPAPSPPSHMSTAWQVSARSNAVRDRRVLQRVATVRENFSSFQSSLAGRVGRSPSSLCVTNAGEEYRMRVERAMIGDQERRIAREAAAVHSAERLTRKEEEGGLALPWEQSLRGATSHSVQVGNLFSGLYCHITQPEMKEMEIVRTTKQIEEADEDDGDVLSSMNPSASTLSAVQQRQRRRSIKAQKAAKSGSSQLIGLVQEAARLQQLIRLAQLGSRDQRRGENAEDPSQQGGFINAGNNEVDRRDRLKLADLLIKGTPLFSDLLPPPPPPPPPAVDEDESPQLTAREAGETQRSLKGEESTSIAPSLFLSCSLLSFSGLVFYPGELQSRHLQLHNQSNSTLHFEWVDAGEREGTTASPFLLSPSSHYVLPHSSLSLCVTFAPPSCGVFRQRMRLVQVDGDDEGEEELRGEVELRLEGVSRDPTLVDEAFRGVEARREVMSGLHSHMGGLVSSVVKGWVTSIHAPSPLPSEQRLQFTRMNREQRLHFHPSLIGQWWEVWEKVKSLYPPLTRPHLQWNLSVEALRGAIEAVPPRHRSLVPSLLERVELLSTASKERPPIHPARAHLLSSLLKEVVRSLPSFAGSLRSSLQVNEGKPWERRAAERKANEVDPSAITTAVNPPSATPALPDATVPVTSTATTVAVPVAAEALPQPALDGVAAPPVVVSPLTAEEEKVDAEWRERSLRFEEDLRVETTAVLSAVFSHFASQAQPENTDAAPSLIETETVTATPAPPTAEGEVKEKAEGEVEKSVAAVLLPRPFRSVVVEVEVAEVVVDPKKGKTDKGKGGKPAQPPSPSKKK